MKASFTSYVINKSYKKESGTETGHS